MKNKKIAIFAVFVLVFTLVGAACQTRTSQKPNVGNERIQNRLARDNNRTRNNNRLNTNIDNDLNNDLNNDLDNDIRNDNMTRNTRFNTASNRAEKIAKKVSNLNEVNSATVVLSGNTALVGINMKNNLEGKMTNNLKNKVEKIVKDTDNNIKTVSVTADADLYKRLSNMARDIRTGKPVSGFAREIQEILRRITPSM
ncbi:YhcN/YlaJ family sporulation lipoprotein [Anaerosalibacter sp. Marseille-P3206]|uniref:YhcN/YlaJ family sporulation lipoprotein n=1 Tax=Anaerosalibacter sp. Marseille-P3206 TaxID=1871005 RepID=UPI0013564195|nr:YhcN/YlaJ family sporulation lipoprotein [Anaerosalibacter sp. Marseille-P3206]